MTAPDPTQGGRPDGRVGAGSTPWSSGGDGLTEDERESLGAIVARYEQDDQGLNEWHWCRECPSRPGMCPCSGRPWLGDEMAAAVERIVAARVDAARAEERERAERVEAERDEVLARLTHREREHADRLAEGATEGDTGICRTCAQPITFETVEEPGYNPRTGWSDGARRDALICFKAVDYRHVPLVGRERAIWDTATKVARAERDAVAATVERGREALDEARRAVEELLRAVKEERYRYERVHVEADLRYLHDALTRMGSALDAPAPEQPDDGGAA